MCNESSEYIEITAELILSDRKPATEMRAARRTNTPRIMRNANVAAAIATCALASAATPRGRDYIDRDNSIFEPVC